MVRVSIPSNLTRLKQRRPQNHIWLVCGMEAITPAPWQNPPLCCQTEENPTPTPGMAPSWVTHDSGIFTHVSSPLVKDGSRLSPTSKNDYSSRSFSSGKVDRGQRFHKPPTSANTAVNMGTSTNTFKGGLCAPPGCANTARLPDPRDVCYSSSKDYLSTSLSSAPSQQSAAGSWVFSTPAGTNGLYIGNIMATSSPT